MADFRGTGNCSEVCVGWREHPSGISLSDRQETQKDSCFEEEHHKKACGQQNKIHTQLMISICKHNSENYIINWCMILESCRDNYSFGV